jgi:glycerophosphoryl diester phosphodiesterase
MRLIANVIIGITFFSCSKNPPNNVRIFGHAGMGLSMQNSIYHDNTIEAVELCLSIPGSDGVEIDIQMDKEGCLWLYHDDFLNRITSENGCVNDKSTQELEKAKYTTLKDEKLVKLKDIIPLIGTNQKLFLDLKSRNACLNSNVDFEKFFQSLNSILSLKSMEIALIVSDSIWIKKLAKYYPTFYSSDNYDESLNFLTNNPLSKGIVIRNKSVEKYQISKLKELNKEIYLFDIRSPKGNRRAMTKNPTGIITDDLRAAIIERSN